jgi:hypothetical protein
LRRDDPNPAPWSKAGKKKIEELGLAMQVRIYSAIDCSTIYKL